MDEMSLPEKLPSFGVSLIPIFLPVVLILLNTVIDAATGDVPAVIEFLGTKTISMLCGVIAATVISIKFLGLLFRQITGSGTVVSLTTFSIMQSVAAVTPIHPVFIALACLSGAMFGATVNDSGFWIVTNMCGFNFSGGVKTYMLGEAIASVVGIILLRLRH